MSHMTLAEIQYHPSAEQLALASTIEDSLAELLPLSRVHRAHEENEDAWRQLEEIGIFAMGLAEAAGGSGLGAAEEALIGMALGRRLAAPAVFATIGAAHALSSPETAPAGRTARVASGYRRGDKVVIVSDHQAQRV